MNPPRFHFINASTLVIVNCYPHAITYTCTHNHTHMEPYTHIIINTLSQTLHTHAITQIQKSHTHTDRNTCTCNKLVIFRQTQPAGRN